jgi:hypothetical protein
MLKAFLLTMGDYPPTFSNGGGLLPGGALLSRIRFLAVNAEAAEQWQKH